MVTTAISAYSTQVVIPSETLAEMEKMHRNFFGVTMKRYAGCTLLSWDIICCPVEVGVLGVHNLKLQIQILLAKLFCRLSRKRNPCGLKCCGGNMVIPLQHRNSSPTPIFGGASFMVGNFFRGTARFFLMGQRSKRAGRWGEWRQWWRNSK